MTEKPTEQFEISQEVQKQRDAILHSLQGEMGRIHTRRKIVRGVLLTAVAPLMVAAAVWIMHPGGPEPNGHADVPEVESQENENNLKLAGESKPQNSRRQVVFETIDDDELLEMLDEMGKPATLGKIGGEWVAVPENGQKIGTF